jgi:predicted small metal-binding protein
MIREVICECGKFEIEYNSVEEMRDKMAEHLMLKHGVVEWEEQGLPDGYSTP